MILSSFVLRLIARYRAYRAYRERLAIYLSALSDRDLAEIGCSRSDIPELARYG